MSALVRICAWCPESDVVTRLFLRDGHQVTHSICVTCVREVMDELDDDDELDPYELRAVADVDEVSAWRA